MSTTSSTPYVPYQAYKSKRHSRVISAPQNEANGTASPPYRPRHISSTSIDLAPKLNGEDLTKTPTAPKVDVASPNDNTVEVRSRPASVVMPQQTTVSEAVSSSEHASPTSPGAQSTVSSVAGIRINDEPLDSVSEPSSRSSVHSSPRATNGSITPAMEASEKGTPFPSSTPPNDQASPEAGPSAQPNKSTYNPRRSSTFRYVPLRPANSSSTPRTSSPLRPANTHSRTVSTSGLSPLSRARQFDQPVPDDRPLQSGARSPASVHSEFTPDTTQASSLKPTTSNVHQRSTSMSMSLPPPQILPPPRTSSLQSPAVLPKPAASPASVSTTPSRVQSPMPPSTPSSSTTTTPALERKAAYRPGFQPKGVYRPLTDDFLASRKRARDAESLELTRLERRFEKLVDLHFSEENGNTKGKEKLDPAPSLGRRASSFLEDWSEFRQKSASELWKSVVESRAAAANGGKGDIRAAEQRITPWQDDADVPTCPHCSASFHPLTNRKHHCRLCGRIICSLPVKKPQRPVPCSLLFISDPKTGRIEEVTEGVDYGVKPRSRVNSMGSKPKGETSEEKFLKGVRICKECKPVMLRQQYRQETKRTPTMNRLYEALIALESEIEEALPHFQELMLNLSNNADEVPTKEASAMRKHLLQCFSDYDAIAKRIRKIPCPGGPGSSQDRVQAAIQARANMFLQKNMFPLQSLPKPKKRSVSGAGANGDAASVTTDAPSQVLDPDSELAQALQPLLEQEALLESFVEEATAHRKFEDARTLKANLAEIRAEIDRILANAEGGM
ncbi:uncharacterized protein FOMMEDRAFT_168848 [Fomitiporia mediterranea MF3/22]|uniref:uncharacterized protein n=1 Tax=Fomitiporia mediterranea (strain MF3/22) TaxID=694068 RepID=UPI0004407610|nr:uncharacterized protein FOMMEDRAFT_168848 [Fomitiporia mediterranea MF3/22]EJD02379.1 hypothetical protein FOMMEDRAFT_168848 [Fomitiporia mediterranea MF3/22]